MSPGMMTSIAAAFAAFLAAHGAGVEYFANHPDVLKFLAEAAQFLVLGLLAAVTAFLSNSSKWEALYRIAGAVTAVIEAEGASGRTDNEKRKRAMDLLLSIVPASQLGWRAWLIKLPFIKDFVAKFIFDRGASAYKALLETGSHPSRTEAKALLLAAQTKAIALSKK